MKKYGDAKCVSCREIKWVSMSMFNLKLCLHCERRICTKSHDKCQNISAKCCACQDKREFEFEGSYSGYIDGVGHVRNKKRWQFYCMTCCAHFQRMEERFMKKGLIPKDGYIVEHHDISHITMFHRPSYEGSDVVSDVVSGGVSDGESPE